MQIKTVFLSGVCKLTVPCVAIAADIPDEIKQTQSIDYVEAGTAYGEGFFKLPGTDTYVRIGGQLQGTVTSPDFALNTDDTKYSARSEFNLSSVSHVSFGTIHTYNEFYYEYDTSLEHHPSSDSLKIEESYLLVDGYFGGVTFGLTTSNFDNFTGYSEIGSVGIPSSDQKALQAAFTANFGFGLTGTIALEDSGKREGINNNVDVVGNIDLTQSWGSLTLAGALHQVADGFSVSRNPIEDVHKQKKKFGFAIGASATANITDVTALTFQAQYADSAISYIGGVANNFMGDVMVEHRNGYDAYADFYGVTGWSAAAGIEHGLTEGITLALDGGYQSFTESDTIKLDLSTMSINGSVAYSPITGLILALDSGWSTTSGTVFGDNADMTTGIISSRIEYTF